MMRPRTLSLAPAFALMSCGVPDPSPGTGGVTLPPDGGAAPCGRGLIVVSSDYLSSNVSLVSSDGEVLSERFFSSASGSTGLSAPLSGDVVIPTTPASGDNVVILDRFPASVVTWVGLETAQVVSQLSLATGFPANVHDYVDVSPTKAYATRYEQNPAPGSESFDAGSDVIVLDPTEPRIVGSIDMVEALGEDSARYQPRPDRIVHVGRFAYVLLGVLSTFDVLTGGDGRIVAIDTEGDVVVNVLVLPGLRGCAGLALSPAGDELGVSCSGIFAGNVSTIEDSGIALVGVSGAELIERRRFLAAEVTDAPLGFSLDYLSATELVVTTFGRFESGSEPARDDTAILVDLASGASRELLRSSGLPFSLGTVRCAAACGLCFVADASTPGGSVHRLLFDGSSLVEQSAFSVDRTSGLPPRDIGRF